MLDKGKGREAQAGAGAGAHAHRAPLGDGLVVAGLGAGGEGPFADEGERRGARRGAWCGSRSWG